MKEEEIVTKVLDFLPDRDQDEAQLAFADFIVAGGRGLGKQENFRLVNDLAAVLGAEVGGTRPLVQAGWIGAERQIGQTGKTIRPKLYIAAAFRARSSIGSGSRRRLHHRRQCRSQRADLRLRPFRAGRRRHQDPAGLDGSLSSSSRGQSLSSEEISK